MSSAISLVRPHVDAIRAVAAGHIRPSTITRYAVREIVSGTGFNLIWLPEGDEIVRLRELASQVTRVTDELRRRRGHDADVDVLQVLRDLVTEALSLADELGEPTEEELALLEGETDEPEEKETTNQEGC